MSMELRVLGHHPSAAQEFSNFKAHKNHQIQNPRSMNVEGTWELALLTILGGGGAAPPELLFE